MSATATLNRESWSQSVLKLLERQHSLVDRLVQLAESQASLIASAATDQLLDLLAQRQTLIDDFTTSQTTLTTLTAGLDRKLEEVAPPERDRIRTLINTIGERLGQVMRRDEQDQASLRSNRDQIRHELSSLGTARQARTAYLPSSGRDANRYSDLQG